MTRIWLLSLVGTGFGLLLTACGEAQDANTRSNRSVGGVKEGAPLAATVSDPGILQDAASYQPAKLPAGQTGDLPRPARPVAPIPVADPASEARDTAAALVDALKDGEVELALRLFNAEQVKPLRAQADVIYATFEKIDLLQRLLVEKLDATRAERLLAELRGGAAEPQTDLLDAEHASVAPNPALVLFGAEKTAPNLQLVRQKNEWRFQLQAELTDGDVQTIKAYHEKLQAALDRLMAWVDASPTVDEAQLQAELSKARDGRPLSIGGGDAGDDEATKEGPEKKPGQGGTGQPARGRNP
jgi:hypothetical protein